jgi:hypothetical protein
MKFNTWRRNPLLLFSMNTLRLLDNVLLINSLLLCHFFSPARHGTTNSRFCLHEINESFVAGQLKGLKTNKATGLEKISALLLKDSVDVISPPVT